MSKAQNFEDDFREQKEWLEWENSDARRAYDHKQLTRARAVLDLILAGPLGDPFDDDPKILYSEYERAVNDAIRANLDLESILQFMQIASANQKSIDSRNFVSIRHRRSWADKMTVFKWCDENMNRFKSMDDAAQDIAESFVPQKFSTVRGWMTDWKKERSTGRP